MSVKARSHIQRVLAELDKEYTNLTSVVAGNPHISPIDKTPDKENVVIDGLSLRLAVDKMSAVLKEAKSLAK